MADERWVTFDCYGTLIDWEGGIGDALAGLWPEADREALLRRYHEIEPRVQLRGALPYREVMRQALGLLAGDRELPLAEADEYALGEALPSWRPFPEVPGALAELRGRGFSLAILSNTDPDLLDASLERIGVPVDARITAAEAAVCYGRIGVSTQEFGGVCQWLMNVLNIVTGNLDRPGGAMFTLPAVDPISAPQWLAPRGSFARRHSRVRKLPEFAGELPVAALAEEILTEGPGQVKAFVTYAGNPVLSTPNGRELDRALASLEFMTSIDFYINETTRHAHIILPPTSPLERGHYDKVLDEPTRQRLRALAGDD